mmetsp:Transcript_25628/g.85565  ORF Transcript_25628/g.85565 Transcript_25628/m.85565 type:complete len:246 (-) Transcript_25628:2-739(-)
MQLLHLGSALLNLHLGLAHVVQLVRVLILGRLHGALELVDPLHELQAFCIQCMEIFLHGVGHGELVLLVPAAVDDGAQEHPQALGLGVPDVREVKVVHEVDQCQVSGKLEDSHCIHGLLVDVRVLEAHGLEQRGQMRLHLLGLHVVAEGGQLLEVGLGLLRRRLVDGLRGHLRVHSEPVQYRRDLLGSQELEVLTTGRHAAWTDARAHVRTLCGQGSVDVAGDEASGRARQRKGGGAWAFRGQRS